MSKAQIKLSYNASDPGSDVSVAADGTYSIVGGGSLRLWTKDGSVVRDRRDVAHAGDFVNADTAYTASQLGIGSDRKVTLWAEALRPSQTLADIRIVARLNPDVNGPFGFGVADAVRLTAFGMEMDQVDASGTLTPADGAAVSTPSPTISLGSFTVQNLHFSSDFSGIIGDVHFTGSIDDAASDLIAGDQGTIQTLSVFAGSSDTPIGTINVTVTKSAGSASLLKPYDFSGTFDGTLSNIDLQPGWNAFRLQAVNAYGFTGTVDVSANVDAEPPADDNIDVQLAFSADPYLDSTSDVTITATFTDNGGVPVTATYTRSPDHPMIFGNVLADFIDLGANTQIFHNGQPDQRIITLTNGQLGLSGEPIVFDKTTDTSNILAGTTLITAEDRPDYKNYTLSLAGTSDPISSGPSDISPYVIKLDGPGGLLASMQSVRTDTGAFPIGLAPDGVSYLMKTADNSRPAILLFTQAPPGAALPDIPAREFTITGAAQYTAGVVVGFTQGGVGMVSGLVNVAKALPGAIGSLYRYELNLGIRFIDGDDFHQERALAAKSWAAITTASQIIQLVSQNDASVIQAIYTGDYEPLNSLSPELKLVVESTVELFENLSDQFLLMSSYEQGKVVGQVIFQIISLVGGYDVAWQVWQSAGHDLRTHVSAVLDRWMTLPCAKARPSGMALDAMRVQLLNVARRRERDPQPFLRRLLEVEPPHSAGGSAPEGSSQAIWNDVSLGLLSPNWDLIISAWSTLTIPFRGVIRNVTAGDVTPPQNLAEPADFAWLDRISSRPRLPAERLLKAYRDLPPVAAAALVRVLLDQYAQWRLASLVPSEGCGQTINFIPYVLAELACFHTPFDAGTLEHIAAMKITYPEGIFRQDDSIPQGKNKLHFLNHGIALIQAAKRMSASPPAVRAGHAELLHLEASVNPLMILLDADLTRDEMAFLKLNGTRIRICDWPSYSDTLCFTKIDLDGGAKLLGDHQPPDIDKYYKGPLSPFVDDRPLVSPFEGTRAAGGIGAEYHIGGVPNWEQEPDIPLSPVDAQPMTFIAQFPHPNDGTAYVFLDYRNLIATVLTQWD